MDAEPLQALTSEEWSILSPGPVLSNDSAPAEAVEEEAIETFY